MLPLSFREFLYFHDFEVRETKSALGGTRRQVFDENGERYELREAFDAYMRFGGMPGIGDIGLDQEKALALLEGIYSTVVVETSWSGRNGADKGRSRIPYFCARSFCFLPITSETAFPSHPSEIP